MLIKDYPSVNSAAKDIQNHLISMASKLHPNQSFDNPSRCLIELNLPVTLVRDVLKIIAFSHKHYELEMWSYNWFNSRYVDVMSLSLYAYQYRILNEKESNVLITWLERVNNWRHSDELSKIFALQVEHNPDRWYPELKIWNISNNSWKRRQSIVAMMEYARLRKKFLSFDDMIVLVDNLIDDKDYYVQKALGWTLRELTVAYPEQSITFIKDHVLQLSSSCYSTAIEKIEKNQLKMIKDKRKTRIKQSAKRSKDSLKQESIFIKKLNINDNN